MVNCVCYITEAVKILKSRAALCSFFNRFLKSHNMDYLTAKQEKNIKYKNQKNKRNFKLIIKHFV